MCVFTSSFISSILLLLSSSPSLTPLLPSLLSYLSLVPAELLSAEVVTGETGIEDYLIEAHQQVSVLLIPAILAQREQERLFGMAKILNYMYKVWLTDSILKYMYMYMYMGSFFF